MGQVVPLPVAETPGSSYPVPGFGPTTPAPPMQPMQALLSAGERLQTGPQRRTASSHFANASTMMGSANLQDIPESLERARQALGLGDLNLAVAYAESAMRLAENFGSNEARLLVDAEAMLIDHILETRIGSLQQRLVVVSVPSNMNSRVSPEQAFLLSRLDGGVSVEEVLDLSPLSRRDTLRQLLALTRDGLVAVASVRMSDKI